MGESGAREVSEAVANVLTKGFSIPTYDTPLSSCTLYSLLSITPEQSLVALTKTISLVTGVGVVKTRKIKKLR